ncbi:MAG TPA: heat-inducible transcriptional repressor HrcA [Dehalococcoidales bacterium]|nr:heat-inducible transcriptional repressor HrcA [Dehalococcoidales bacterium]
MLSTRTEAILNSIVREYIVKATPVSSQNIVSDYELGVSSATIRNEMARLEEEGYITRPYPSAGSIPSDMGYRYYVESLSDIELPLAEQRLISHLFHQVEKQLDEWLSLTATLIALLVQNMAVVTIPKPADCQFKYLEVIILQDSLALVILVLRGAKVKEQLITLNQNVSQPELTASTNRLNTASSGLTGSQILVKDINLSPTEQQITDCAVDMMRIEDKQAYEEPYLNGWHFMLNQPEFARSHQMLTLMELVERRELLKSIIPEELSSHEVRVVIGKENKAEAIHNYSVVISQYGAPREATGTIGVIGPTRMPYAHAISTVSYLASVLNELVAELYR